ncbi:MAG: hypothetical protein MUC91_14370 [Verrucomicrobia bacterium]|nr:hypothetical protein [Verrucomicrobiota bacterium]
MKAARSGISTGEGADSVEEQAQPGCVSENILERLHAAARASRASADGTEDGGRIARQAGYRLGHLMRHE